jgi:S-disulfanyl-L-cysteine oxidoreductase SoxD
VKICKISATLLAAFAILQFRAPAQPPVSTRDGVYADRQATRGEAMYKKACASCHREMLEGNGTAPALAGDDFAADWKGKTLAALLNKIEDTMPADSPGSLSPEQAADLIAYILKFNKLPAGKSELPSEGNSLKQIRFEMPE